MSSARFLAPLACLACCFVAGPARATDPDRVEWSPDWRRMAPWEVAGSFGLVAADVGIQLLIPTPTKADFTGGILFDDWVRKEVKGQNHATQRTAADVSNYFFKGGIFVPFVMDGYLGALSIHENTDVAAQLFAMDIESFAVAGLFSVGAEKLVGRARPYVDGCGPNGEVPRDSRGRQLHTCNSGENQSFFSGHSSATATTAGLVCAAHQHLPLFGGGVADLAPCVVMIGISGATGVLRIMADDHWASDVVIGWSVGVFSGYVLPSLLHYGWGNRGHTPLGEVKSGSLVMEPTLLPAEGGAEVGAVGTF